MLPAYLATCLCAIFVLLVGVLADPAPGPTPEPYALGWPRRQAAVQRPSSTPPLVFEEAEEEFDVEVLPFVLVSSIDGALHAIDRETGNVRWTLRDGVEPLVGGGIVGDHGEEQYIVEPLSGNLYVFDRDDVDGEPKLRKVPRSVEELIENTPFRFPDSPSRMFTGKKETSILTLDIKTGQQIDCYSSHTPLAGICERDPLDDLESKARHAEDLLFVGRTDYTLMIRNLASTDESLTAALTAQTNSVQRITYSTYVPNTNDRALANFWERTGGKSWTSSQKRTRVELGPKGIALGIEEGVGMKWNKPLDAVGVAVYDVVLPLSSGSASPIILPQPRADLLTLFPAADPERLAAKQQTFIGTVPLAPALLAPSNNSDAEFADDDQTTAPPLLFAQSSNGYPLVNVFPGTPKPGSLVNATFAIADEEAFGQSHRPFGIEAPRDMDTVPEREPPGPAQSESDTFQDKARNKRWWWILCGEVVAVLLWGLGIYRWGFTKATAAAAAASAGAAGKALPPNPEVVDLDDKLSTPVVRFEALPAPSINGTSAVTEPGTPPKKKSTRRRVRGKKKRRGSVGPLLDRDEDEDDEGDMSPGPSPAISSAPSSDSKDDKPLPDLPRNSSSVSLPGDHQERLSISDTVIGFGSHGTVVLKGTWGGRPVAVKRLLSDFVRLASQEVKLLQASDDHPNVIRYFCQEKRDNFLYIALDLCQASLADLIETPDQHNELAASLEHKKALSQITAGLQHLHGMKIIHRDIKPQNVLVSRGKDGSLRMLVSDFGLARRLEQGQSSFAPTANNLAGSLGWRAPECIRGQVKLNEGFDPVLSCSSSGSATSSTGSLLELVLEDGERKQPTRARLTKAVDLFALGCLYFWVLMGGEHPYGETYNRESNIVKGDIVNLDSLTLLGEEGYEAQDLIRSLLSLEPAERPDTSECLIHPFFWTPSKRLSFLCDASDRFEIMENDPPESTLVMLETGAVDVCGKDWYSRMDRVFTSSLGKFRKYKGNSVRDLLRAMRNKKHHYQDLDASAKKHFGALPAGFLRYFTSKFPHLFLHVHSVVRDSRLRHEPMFESYFHRE